MDCPNYYTRKNSSGDVECCDCQLRKDEEKKYGILGKFTDYLLCTGNSEKCFWLAEEKRLERIAVKG
jgi:hypothetical protein